MRGASSLKGSNEPLVIIDGMPGNMTSLNAIAPEDIEAIDVLKDVPQPLSTEPGVITV